MAVTVKLADIAGKHGITPKRLASRLRNRGIVRPGPTWTWPLRHPDVKEVRQIAKEMAKPIPTLPPKQEVKIPRKKAEPEYPVLQVVMSETAKAKISAGMELAQRGVSLAREGVLHMQMPTDFLQAAENMQPTDLSYSTNRQVYRRVIGAAVLAYLAQGTKSSEEVVSAAHKLASAIVAAYTTNRNEHGDYKAPGKRETQGRR